jgi:Zn-dependent protease/CBS domain-containing protein
MGWSIRIARVFGTDVKIHITFLLLLAWFWFMHYRIGGTEAAWQGVLFIILLFGCVLLHEFGHALAARRFGIKTPDITLLPIGGVARLQRMPDKPAQELVVALAGPAVNVVIAVVLFAILGRVAAPTELAHLENPRIDMMARLAGVNVILVVFNLIPAFPMDGGRVLRALLAMKLNYAQATLIAARIGQGMAFLFGFIGLLVNPLLIFIAIFIYLGAAAEAGAAQLREVATGMPVSDAMVTRFVALPPEARIEHAVDALVRTTQHEFPIVGPAGQLEGILTRDDIIRGLREGGPDALVSTVMHRDVPVAPYDASFDQAFRMMQECHCPGIGVVNREGALVGLLTPEAVGEMMMIRSVLPQDALPSWRRDSVAALPDGRNGTPPTPVQTRDTRTLPS